MARACARSAQTVSIGTARTTVSAGCNIDRALRLDHMCKCELHILCTWLRVSFPWTDGGTPYAAVALLSSHLLTASGSVLHLQRTFRGCCWAPGDRRGAGVSLACNSSFPRHHHGHRGVNTFASLGRRKGGVGSRAEERGPNAPQEWRAV